jgi:hypothetical protein
LNECGGGGTGVDVFESEFTLSGSFNGVFLGDAVISSMGIRIVRDRHPVGIIWVKDLAVVVVRIFI